MKTLLATVFFTLSLFSGLSADSSGSTHPFSAEDRAWWAIQPVRDVKVPEAGAGWSRNEVDHFVARKLEGANLQPAPEADRLELVRRVYFDLHGLPPTPEQVDAFVNDSRPDAWQRLVTQLLDSPRYGERWAQHWLDVVRFAESDGYREDAFRPNAYAYRDYVIRQFNRDTPYDQFVREQLAGDELFPDNPELFVGTGFLRHGIYEWNQRNVRMHWDLIMNEMTRVTGEAFLGVGIGCAQCHDHKFDPILQKDYYAMQAFLSSTTWPLEAWAAPREKVEAFQKKQKAWEFATESIRSEMESLVKSGIDGKVKYTVGQFPEDIQAIYHKSPGERTPHEEQLAYLVSRQVERAKRGYTPATALKGKPEKLKRYLALKKELKQFDELKPEPLPKAFVPRDVGKKPVKTYIKSRTGSVEVSPGVLALLGQTPPQIEPGSDSTGRRTALANWIADAGNPLSTRVIVNRVWQRHFRQGIVATPNDFGRLGDPPSHPELLDWLTKRFVSGGWKFKSLHRLILNSATYRQTARREPSSVENEKDGGNKLLWRFPPRRLDAEEVRDAMLSVSGELKHRAGGPSLSGNSVFRSVYVKKLRNSPDEVLNQFDAPAGFDSVPNRISTTTPLQSLLLLNSKWANDRSAALAGRLTKGRSEFTAEMVERSYQLVFGRAPSRDETASALAFVTRQTAAVTLPVGPVDKFPNETGLRPITQQFGKAKSVEFGSSALWIQPGSRFERLNVSGEDLKEGPFSIEAVANLDRIYPDASVNTLVARWDGSRKTMGWSFGVTSEESSYQPRNVIFQFVGREANGKLRYEVVPSGLRFPLGKPMYVGATIQVVDGQGVVKFFMKDLSDPGSTLETRTVKSRIVSGLQNDRLSLLVGGRASQGHRWDGQLARLRIVTKPLTNDEIEFKPLGKAGTTMLNWMFGGNDGEHPAEGATWLRPAVPTVASMKQMRVREAVADFCQALLNSNEFLYLH